MKKLVVIACVGILALGFSGLANALSISDPWASNGSGPEKNLYNIFNETYGTSFTSSMNLYSTYGSPAQTFAPMLETVELTVKYAGFGQTLGYQDGSGAYDLVARTGANGAQNASATFEATSNFVFYDKVSGGANHTWYSEDSLNSDALTHFVAFDVSSFYGGIQAWFIAFEDGYNDHPGLYDSDYNDLVAVVVATPEPTTVLLLGVGLLGLFGIGRKHLKK